MKEAGTLSAISDPKQLAEYQREHVDVVAKPGDRVLLGLTPSSIPAQKRAALVDGGDQINFSTYIFAEVSLQEDLKLRWQLGRRGALDDCKCMILKINKEAKV